MVSSKAPTVTDYLAELPPERRAVVATVRDLVNRNLPSGYVETMRWGMITWEIPLARYPVTYNGQPLSYAALAAQKNNYALYLMQAYADPVHEGQLRRAYAAAGKRLDMGKSCLRFRRLDDLIEGAVAAVIASASVDDYIARYERTRSGPAVGARPLAAERPAQAKTTKPAGKAAGKVAAAKPKPAAKTASKPKPGTDRARTARTTKAAPARQTRPAASTEARRKTGTARTSTKSAVAARTAPGRAASKAPKPTARSNTRRGDRA